MSGFHSDNWRSRSDWRTPESSASTTKPASRPIQQQSQQQARYLKRGRDDKATEQAASVAEGRRIYLGNILYRVKPREIEEMLDAVGFEDQYEAIHISVDAVTGRNPGYCFVDFKQPDNATLALESLRGVTILDRPVKVGPCHPKAPAQDARNGDYKPTFQRWGDWSSSRRPASGDNGSAPLQSREQGPHTALDHLDAISNAKIAPRLWVGGLGKMINQAENDMEVRAYFEGFNIIAISKRITPSAENISRRTGNQHYWFVDFINLEEAQAALEAVNGRPIPGGRLRLRMARVLPEALRRDAYKALSTT